MPDAAQPSTLGARLLEASISSAVGGVAAGLVLDAVLGTSGKEAAFQNEVISALKRIETKLDEVLKFIYAQLPELIRKVMSEELRADTSRLIRAQADTAGSVIATFEARGNDVTAAHIDGLANYGLAAFESGLKIVQDGDEWYLAGIHAFTVGLACFARVIPKDSAYAAGLRSTALSYAKVYGPMVTAGISGHVSFTEKAAQLREELAISDRLLPWIPIGQSGSKVAISWYDRSIVGIPVDGVGGPVQYLETFGGVFSRTADGTLEGKKHVETALLGTDPMAAFQQNRMVIPFWRKPTNEPANQTNWDAMTDTFFHAIQVSQANPAKIIQMDVAVQTITPFLQALEVFSGRQEQFEAMGRAAYSAMVGGVVAT